MDIGDLLKRLRRIFDGNLSNRKSLLIILGILVLILYLAPNLYRLLSSKPSPLETKDKLKQVLSFRLDQFYAEKEEYDVNIQHIPLLIDEKSYVPYIGNGYIGLNVDPESPIMIRNGRTLSLAVNFRPITLFSFEGLSMEEALITQYKKGMVTRFQVWESLTGETIEISYQAYAHRVVPSLLMQSIKVTNPTAKDVIVETDQLGLKEWNSATSRVVKIQHGNGQHDYVVINGMVEIPGTTLVVAVCIVTLKVPPSIQVAGKLSTTLHIVSSVNYSEPIQREFYSSVKEGIEASALKTLKETVTGSLKRLSGEHVDVWHKLWLSGFAISESKAENAINGDLINATIYCVLSQSAAPLYEVQTLPSRRESILRDLAYADGCYGGHHTLQAERLWSKLDSIDDATTVVSLWIMTLEKQGCHQLVRAGADGVLQAMLLSFGGFQFRNQHLEFNADPSHLHRNYWFRRISYGNATHLNISVVVQEEDYKAVIYLALDRSDKSYYGCDAGCLDPPVQLGPEQLMFPVKLTQPLTSILYITSDKVHMEELKHTIHVKEIAIAPPHEHHVMALHKHGHKWGGLPTLFWMAIVALIVVFHLFLFKLVVNEYCGGADAAAAAKSRYRKFSDFQ